MTLIYTDQSERKKSEGYQMSVLMDFIKLKPPAFEGHPDPLAAARWLEAVKTMLDSLRVEKDFQVQFATYLFDGPAEDWWDMKGDLVDVDLVWEEFETLFRETYAPETLRHEMIAELEKLEQWPATVSQYHARFVELCCYDPLMVADPVSKCTRFWRGLTHQIKSRLRPSTFTVLGDLVNAAQSVETYLEQEMDGIGSSTAVSKELYRCYRCNGAGHLRHNCPLKKTQSSGGKLQVVAKKGIGSSTTLSKELYGCYRCNGVGHQRHNCPLKKTQSTGGKSQLVTKNGIGASTALRKELYGCYHCNGAGHQRHNCPLKKTQSPGGKLQVVPKNGIGSSIALSKELPLKKTQSSGRRLQGVSKNGIRSSTTLSKELNVCYRCSVAGHQRRNCPLKKTQTPGGKLPVVAKNPRNSLGIRRISKTKARSRNFLLSLGLGQVGHRAREQSRQSNSGSSKPRTTTECYPCYQCGLVGHKNQDCPRQQVGSALSVGGPPPDQSSPVFDAPQIIQPQPSTLYTSPLQSLRYLLRYQPPSSVFDLNLNAPTACTRGFLSQNCRSSFNFQ